MSEQRRSVKRKRQQRAQKTYRHTVGRVIYSRRALNLFMIIATIFNASLMVSMIEQKAWVPVLFFVWLSALMLRYWISIPNLITTKRDLLRAKYFFSQKTFRAQDIETINIREQLLNMGRGPRLHAYIDIRAKNNDQISFEYFRGQLPDVHEVLVNWRKTYT
jgi:hypothetical protein